MKTENQDLNMFMDGLEGILSEIRDELLKINQKNKDSPEASLSIDLLNRISDTIGQAKKAIDEEDLKKFINAVISVTTQLQEEANKASAEFLNQKIAELKELAKQPTIIERRYSIDFKSSRTFTAIVLVSLALLCSLLCNYNQYQSNNELTDADWKYRFVKMNGGIYTDDVFHLERMFGSPDSVKKVKGLKGQILDYEMKLREQIEKQELIDRNMRENEKLDSEIKMLKGQ
ncbi:hypothetical protein CLV62_13219 [Dysgonomonas alginatilytica]|uniref:Uncharacterized protein n=1 Tax=Dysgonomonas alginatilytica TaxID=1605892 RepID=A0A2V3PJQ3_9BACT|nr:hypothetical protein [Dysgonomonas alginatilytica]PXV60031.1 hypothetical protein CLV62_13219 [Dysgonomonas alginatilytica]